MLCFCFGGSRQSLKVHEVKCVPGDPTITCPVLFKGVLLPAVIGLALCNLLYVASLSHKVVLSVLLAVLCYACGPIFIYYKRALRVYGCMRSLRIQPYKKSSS